MIQITRRFNTVEEAQAAKKRYHEALHGSPAYINSEIAILGDDDSTEFVMLVGNSNSKDIVEILDGITIAAKTKNFM